MDPALASALAVAVLAAQCAVAAYMDFRHRVIPNLLCLSVIVTGVAAGAVTHDLGWVAMGLAHALIALLVGMALFATSVIGGGDAKFYAAVAVWVPLQSAFLMLVAVAALGVVLLLMWFPLRARIAAMAPTPARAADFMKLPYGMAIAAGGWLTYFVSTGS